MDNFQFWKGWSKEYKYFFYFTLSLLTASFLFYVVGLFSGIDFILDWNSISELTTTPINYGEFTDYYHEFKLESFNYLIYEKYASPLIELQPWLATTYLLIIFGLVILFLTISTTLSKTLYYLSIVLIMLFLATLNFDLLEITKGINKNILAVSIILFGGLSYTIYSFYSHISLTKRFIIFSLVSTFFVFLIYNFSPLTNTSITYHLVGYGSSSLITITGIFIIYVAIENSLFLLFLNSNSPRKEKRGSLNIYMLINVLYIFSLSMMYFFNIKLIGINAFTILLSSSILTIWGTIKRNENNKKGDTIARTIIVTIISAIALSTIGYHATNGNSSLLKAFEREILVTFLCYSTLFFVYTMYNFIGYLHDKVQVYKLVFKPLKLSTYHMYMMGTVAAMALFFKESKKPYYQALSGYYNSIADAYLIQEEYDLASTFYEIGRKKDAYNHRSNITMASLAINNGNLKKAITHYKNANYRKGSIHSYIQLSNIYYQQDNYFDALFTLQEGLEKFPNSYHIYNNLGILSKKSDLNDSTIFYFNKAMELSGNEDIIPFNNLLTFYIKKGENEKAKKLVESTDDSFFNTNTKTALSTYNAKLDVFNKWTNVNIKADTFITNENLSYMFNHFINNINLMSEKEFLAVDTSYKSNNNVLSGEQFTLMKAYYEFYNNDPKIARDHLATLASSKSFFAGYYNNLLGLWMMLQKNYYIANKYFEIADKYNFNGAKFNHAFVLTAQKRTKEANIIWNELLVNPKSRSIANSFLKITDSDIKIDSLSDYEKLLYASFNDNVNFPALISSTNDTKIKTLIELQQIQSLINNDLVKEALAYCDALEADGEKVMFANNKLYLLRAEALTRVGKNKDAIKILDEMDAPIEFKAKSLLIKSKAFENIKEIKKATDSYKSLIKYYPFYKDGVLASTKYFKSIDNNTEAYNIIVDAIRTMDESTDLLEEYAFLCLKERLLDYGDETVEKLSTLMDKEKFTNFNAKYQTERVEIQQIFDNWEDSDE